MLLLSLGVAFTLATCRLHRDARFAAVSGLPENLSDFGPVVSCNDDDLERFINKSREVSEVSSSDHEV